MTIPTTYTIISRSDKSEYLSRFEFFSPEMPTWSKDIIRSHSDAESNARLDNPLNRRIGLKYAGEEGCGRVVSDLYCQSRIMCERDWLLIR
jgi:hypothetical protein